MKKHKISSRNVHIVVIFILAYLPLCKSRSVFSHENKDLYGIFNDYQKDISEDNENMIKNNSYSIYAISTSREPPKVIVTPIPISMEETSLWPSGTMTRKHFEIINMLWRKTKIFIDNTDFVTDLPSWKHNNMTTKLFKLLENEDSIVLFSTRPPVTTTPTPSNIEFYYLNDVDNVNKIRTSESKCEFGSKCRYKKDFFPNKENSKDSNSSFIVFHIRGPSFENTQQEQPVLPTQYHNNAFLKITPSKIFNTSLVNTTSRFSNRNNSKKESSNNFSLYNFTHLTTDNVLMYFNGTFTHRSIIEQDLTTKKYPDKSMKYDFYTKTTVYDKIKFFEMYDRMTPVTPSQWNVDEPDNMEDTSQQKENEQRIFLINVDQGSHEHNRSKHIKKHILEDQPPLSTANFTEDELKENIISDLKNEIKNYNSTPAFITQSEREFNRNDVVYNYFNKTVKWADYPFAAVYIYEPSQIHCDAAAISAHWLVASGACLSRLTKNPNGGGRTAFVAYCGGEWWKPERVSYVKYSLVHPWFHPTEKPRKYLYNIGLVQVVTSMMSACSGWSPVTLMSHQFATSQEGTVASALGWGLDRYDTRFTPMKFPRSQLTLYKALLFSDSCPGIIDFNEGKSFDQGIVNKNVYCLALPPYYGEATDPVHGGLLLVGTNLIALYLQEERRPWGEQSAQYTGIWRLIPWITDVAKETEDIETSFIEI